MEPLPADRDDRCHGAMSRYAEASRCPDCAARLSPDAESCPSCSLPLRGPLAHELYQTLLHADELVAALRAMAQPPVPQPAAPGPPAVVRRPGWAPPVWAIRPSAMSGASVPKLLLGLGALCLLVAALVFLAVTWSVLGVGGRTATLVGLTAVSAAVTAVVARHGLRGATEALGLVTLGLVALDVTGADSAGWFGDLGPTSFLVVLGGVLVVSATAACLAVRRAPAHAFTSGEVVTGLGWFLVVGGIDWNGSATPATWALLATLLAAAGAASARRLRLTVATRAVASVTGFAWLFLASVGLDRLSDELTVAHVWGDLAAWPLVAAAVLVSALALAPRLPVVAREGALAVGAAMVASVVVCPALDNGATPATLAVLVTLAAALGVLWFVPRPWSAAALLTAALGTALAAVQALLLGAQALERLEDALLTAGSLDGRLPAAQVVDLGDGLQPWLLVPDAGLTILAVLVLRRLLASTIPVRLGLEVAVLAAASATALLYPVPVWTLVAGLLVAGLVLLAVDDLAPAALAFVGGLAVATYSDGLTALALAVLLVTAGAVNLRDRRDLVAGAAGVVTATALAASVWFWGDLLDRPGQWTAAVGIVVVAVLGLVRARRGVDLGAALGLVGLALAGLAVAPLDQTPTWAAVYLTLAGAATSLEAILDEDRRVLGWVGGLLLAAASWVRLADLGVHEPEPYTLPAAVALLVVGVVQLRRRPGGDTVRTLGPGLGLALVPSLLWVLDDPTTPRSLLLGLACIGLVVAGLQLRWTAPLLFGAVVGAAIVLRSAAPYVGDAVPRWATIGTAGVLLVALGITWEQRVREARLLVGYVRQLR